MSLLDLPHHDGSGSYLVERPPSGSATRPSSQPARPERDGGRRGRRPLTHPGRGAAPCAPSSSRRPRPTVGGAPPFPSTTRRFPIAGSSPAVSSATPEVNGLGLVLHDPPDSDDFVVSLDPGGPDWHLRSVVYEVFPDRFARGAHRQAQPDWAVAREWDEFPAGRAPQTPLEWYGGDLAGLEERLDHPRGAPQAPRVAAVPLERRLRRAAGRELVPLPRHGPVGLRLPLCAARDPLRKAWPTTERRCQSGPPRSSEATKSSESGGSWSTSPSPLAAGVAELTAGEEPAIGNRRVVDGKGGAPPKQPGSPRRARRARRGSQSRRG